MDLISIHDELLYIHLNGWYLKSKEFTMRKFITVINVMLMLTGKTVYAEDIDIVVTGTVTRSYSVNLTNKVTLGSGLSNCAMIGSVNSIDMGGTVATKNDGSGKVAYYTLIERSSVQQSKFVRDNMRIIEFTKRRLTVLVSPIMMQTPVQNPRKSNNTNRAD
jgi:hypothetical protein